MAYEENPVNNENEPTESPEMSIDEIMAALNSQDEQEQIEVMKMIRENPEVRDSLPMEDLKNLAFKCVDLLQEENPPQVQDEAARLLAFITLGTLNPTSSVIKHDALPLLLVLLQSAGFKLKERAAWALTIIAFDSCVARNEMIEIGVIDVIVGLQDYEGLPSMIYVVTLMMGLCNNEFPSPPFEKVKRLLPMLSQLLLSPRADTVEVTCLTLLHIMDVETEQRIQSVLDTGAAPRLVNLLGNDNPKIVLAALHCVGVLVMGTNEQINAVLAFGVVEILKTLLQHQDRKIVKIASLAVGNITSGSQQRIQAVIEAGIFYRIQRMIEKKHSENKSDAAYIVYTVVANGTPRQLAHLITNHKILRPFIRLLDAKDTFTLTVVLKGLERLFELAKSFTGTQNLCVQLLEVYGLTKLQALQQNENAGISNLAKSLLQTFFKPNQATSKEGNPPDVKQLEELNNSIASELLKLA
ncbi:importin subunit alpha-like [Drosophila tropicalis]|uniref:importin subunit alpha-like n=1 Tax=Drosophila tropicalis TaxID=46794 RepID=UPI0035ABD5CA